MTSITKLSQNEGKKLSFYQIFSLEKLSIEIPIIQRDYAQGRDSASNIRSQFVKAIFKSLVTKETLHLDFVYGNVVDKKFTPLDGQQRLTTLFLLHWYLSIKDSEFHHFQNFIRLGDLSKFTYETRLSSREFCHELVKHKISEIKEGQTYSSTIKNKNWYFSTWEKDPTIKSMLVMLDTIDEIYNSLDNPDKLYKQLIDEKNPTITFQFIELKDFGLSDSLYIKMNARGKPLTDFENFKAKFEQLLINYDIDNNKKYSDLFKENIDNSWSDVFWSFRNKNSRLFDQEFMNFVQVVLIGALASNSDDKSKILGYMTKSDGKLGYYELERYGALNDRGVEDIITFLRLIEDNKQFKHYLSDNLTVDERQLFLDVINHDLTYIKRIQFYALYKYVEYNKGKDGIDEWMRVVRNLSTNSVYRQSDTFEIAIKSIDQMLPYSKTILEYIQLPNKPKGFLGFQLDEEEIKSHLIQRSEEWEKNIKETENHGYFNGQIEFLLDFSGITSYFKENKNTDWSDSENQVYLEKFDFYRQRATIIFNDSGLNTFPEFLFERALLSIGDYTLTKGRNRSFLVNNDREIGWKRLLRDSENQKRKFVKILFDSITSCSNIEETLRLIIANCKTTSWRRYFIKYPQTIEKCGTEKLFRVGSSFNDILLLEKKQTNGRHREYFTYGLNCQLEEMGCKVEYQTANSVDDLKFISGINGIPVYIFYRVINDKNDYGFFIEHGNDEYNYKNENETLDLLTSKGFINKRV